MSIKVIGAGLGRTGTHSLKVALQILLDKPCYHMVEVFENPHHVPAWHAAAKNQPVNWPTVLGDYSAAVDWPASAFWPELMSAYPEALVILSERDPEAWWNSASETIFKGIKAGGPPGMEAWHAMVMETLGTRFCADLSDKEACMQAFVKHNEAVRAGVPSDRLLVWQARDGWKPICDRLNLPVPAMPFPLTNTKEEFQARLAGIQADPAQA